MRLPGYLDPRFSPPAPSIAAELESRNLRLKASVSFLIDAEASATVLLDRDVKRLSLDWEKLGREAQLAGIGGSVETRLIRDGRLSFQTSSPRTVTERVVIFAARHDPKIMDGRARRLVLRMPSLLGRDILERYRVVYDGPKARVFLER